jgi:hypothetical protein
LLRQVTSLLKEMGKIPGLIYDVQDFSGHLPRVPPRANERFPGDKEWLTCGIEFAVFDTG